jgi:hypothetical protein
MTSLGEKSPDLHWRREGTGKKLGGSSIYKNYFITEAPLLKE